MGRWAPGDPSPWTDGDLEGNPGASTTYRPQSRGPTRCASTVSTQSKSPVAQTVSESTAHAGGRSQRGTRWGLRLRSALNAPPTAPQGYAPAEPPARVKHHKRGHF